MAEETPITGTIAVEGLTDVLAGLKQFQGGLRSKLRENLISVANRAATFAVFIARSKGLYESGELIDGIKAGFRSSYAYITDKTRRVSPAYPEGFNYPAIYEYGGSQTRGNHAGSGFKIRNRSTTGTRLIAQFGLGEGNVGPRAFLWPAAVQGESQLVPAVQLAIEQLARDSGLSVV
jgi:hypothetical protein